MARMRIETIERQLLPLLALVRKKYLAGVGLHEALREATQQIADENKTTQQNITDGYTRRLNLTGDNAVDRFRELLRLWLDAAVPGPLITALKSHAHENAHNLIEAFFSQLPASQVPQPLVATACETMSFELPQNEARMLRALAANDGVSEGEFVGQAVRAALAAKMKAVAHELWPR